MIKFNFFKQRKLRQQQEDERKIHIAQVLHEAIRRHPVIPVSTSKSLHSYIDELATACMSKNFIEISKLNEKPVPNEITNYTPVQSEYPIKYVFTSNGIDYYEFEDYNNMPPLRALKTAVFYEEFKMKTSLTYLEYHVEAVANIYSQERIDIFKANELNEQLRQRLKLPLEVELMYKLASVSYFDRNEDYHDYDFAYNISKIAGWKREGVDFFLREGLIKLMPVLKDLDKGLDVYLNVLTKLNDMHMENILQALPESTRKKLNGSSFFSAMVMPKNSSQSKG